MAVESSLGASPVVAEVSEDWLFTKWWKQKNGKSQSSIFLIFFG
ncbi:hypothetical protein VCHE09_1704 [Vibrio paracholerae HE-09]|nr:hypothetical protein VCHE09_1704 [Vibrio paracholerae HE-09]